MSRRNFCFAFFVLALAVFSSCKTAQTIQYSLSDDDIRVDSGSVPMEIVEGDAPGMGMVLVPVKFNGHVEKCLLDTGSTASIVVANPFFKSLVTSERSASWGVAGKSSLFFLIRVDQLEIGNSVLKDQRLVLDDENGAKGEGFPYRCLIGLDLLSRGAFALDFKKKLFSWYQRIPAAFKKEKLAVYPSGGFSVPFSLRDGAPIYSFFDTGANATAVDPSIIQSYPSSFRLLGDANDGIDVHGNHFSYKIYRMKNARLGHRLVRESFAIAKELDLAWNVPLKALIGFDLIRRQNWIFDLRRREWANF